MGLNGECLEECLKECLEECLEEILSLVLGGKYCEPRKLDENETAKINSK